MPATIRFARPGRRHGIGGSSPRVSLQVTRDADDLGAARGVLMGAVIGGMFWIGILAWFIWS
jgi:hypothetical protein